MKNIVQDLITEVTGHDKVELSDKLADDLNMDYFDLMELLIELEERYDVCIDNEEIPGDCTVQDLVVLVVVSKLEGGR